MTNSASAAASVVPTDTVALMFNTLQIIISELEPHSQAKQGNSRVHYCLCMARTAVHHHKGAQK